MAGRVSSVVLLQMVLSLQGILEENDIHKQEANPVVMRCKIHHGSTGGVCIHDGVGLYHYH